MRTRLPLALAGLALAGSAAAVPASAAHGTAPSASATSAAPAGTRITAATITRMPGAREVAPRVWAAPLRAARPSWVTPALLAKARKGPTPAPASAIPDLPATGFVGIRPGSWEIDPYGCTMNFVFQRNGHYAIGTAGHCTDKTGQMITLVTVAPGGSNPVLVTIGPVLYRTFNAKKIAPDFSLVAVPDTLASWVFPTEAQVLGPCGTYTGAGLAQVPIPTIFKGQDSTVGPEVVSHYGHGLGIGTGGTSRSGAAVYWENTAYYWDSPSAPGDSGSAVRVSNLAGAGNLTDLVVDLDRPGALVEGTRLTAIERLINGWTLVSSPYCP